MVEVNGSLDELQVSIDFFLGIMKEGDTSKSQYVRDRFFRAFEEEENSGGGFLSYVDEIGYSYEMDLNASPILADGEVEYDSSQEFIWSSNSLQNEKESVEEENIYTSSTDTILENETESAVESSIVDTKIENEKIISEKENNIKSLSSTILDTESYEEDEEGFLVIPSIVVAEEDEEIEWDNWGSDEETEEVDEEELNDDDEFLDSNWVDSSDDIEQLDDKDEFSDSNWGGSDDDEQLDEEDEFLDSNWGTSSDEDVDDSLLGDSDGIANAKEVIDKSNDELVGDYSNSDSELDTFNTEDDIDWGGFQDSENKEESILTFEEEILGSSNIKNNEDRSSVKEDIIYKDLREFVKLNPNCDISLALKYFSKRDIDKQLSLGRVFKRKNRLMI